MRRLLVLNAGSSSLKFAVFETGDKALGRTISGQVESIGDAARMTARDAAGEPLPVPGLSGSGHEAVLKPLLDWVSAEAGEIAAVGHRIVHGGGAFSEPVVLTPAVVAELDGLCPLAPLHQPHNLSAVRAIWSGHPGLVQVGCFDTAFHHGQAEVVTRYAVPRKWFDRGVRRYGFHGLSYEYVAGRLREIDPGLAAGRVIAAHLGNGASLCAIHDGRSIDTTMGFTALDGLVMGTRCGSLDPGVVLYLQQEAGLSLPQVQALLYHQSGLLGVSQISADMRALLASRDPKAEEAIDLFTFRIAREAGALMSSMGGLDGIVFTAGIGERSPEIRETVARRLAWTGLALDRRANEAGDGLISAPESRVRAWVIATDEERMIARHTEQLLYARRAGAPARETGG